MRPDLNQRHRTACYQSNHHTWIHTHLCTYGIISPIINHYHTQLSKVLQVSTIGTREAAALSKKILRGLFAWSFSPKSQVSSYATAVMWSIVCVSHIVLTALHWVWWWLIFGKTIAHVHRCMCHSNHSSLTAHSPTYSCSLCFISHASFSIFCNVALVSNWQVQLSAKI